MPGQLKFQAIKQRVPAAVARALNRSIASARTALNRAIAQDTRLKVGYVGAKIRMGRATEDRPSARLYANVRPVPLAKFSPRGRYPSRGKGAGVSATIAGAGVNYPHGFIALVGPKKYRGVFERQTKARGPIDQIDGPSIADLAEKHKAVAEARGREQLVKNLASEFRFALSRTA